MKPTSEHRGSGLTLYHVDRLAQQMARCLARMARVDPTGITVGLSGDLGSGKTTFAQCFVKSLDGGESLQVTSPTYSIWQTYPTRPEVRHGDWYRLSSIEELEVIGYAESMDAPGINLVEWIRQVPDGLPVEWIELVFTGERELRDVTIRAFGERWFTGGDESFWSVCKEALASTVVDD